MTTTPAASTKSRADGTGSVYEDKKRGDWVAVVPLPANETGGRRRLKRRFASERAAETGLVKLHREVASAGGNVTTTDQTAAQWLTYWIDEVAPRRLAPTTVRNWRSTINRHLIPALGKTKLRAITPATVRRVHDAVRAKPEVTRESTVLLAHRVLAIALRDAKREGILQVPDLPTAMTDAPPLNASTREPLLVDHATRLLAAINPDDPLAARWAAAVLLGARQGELLGLERDRVHDDHIDVSWQLQSLEVAHGCGDQLPGGVWRCGVVRASRCTSPKLRAARPGFLHRHLEGSLFLTKPKTKSGNRYLPLIEPMRTILLTRIEESSGGRHGLVWHTDEGAPVRPRDDSAAWHELLERANVPSRALHTARGTTASVLMRAGVADAVRISLLGHSKVSHLAPYEHAEAQDRIAAMTAVVQALTGTAGGGTTPADGPPLLRLVK